PARAGGGRVPLVEDGDRGLEVGRYQVWEEGGQLGAGEQGLVHHRTTRERTREEALELGSRRGDPLLNDAAGEIERPLPRGRVQVPAARGRGDHGLPDGGAGGAGGGPEYRRLDGDIAPAEHGQACTVQHVFDDRGGPIPGAGCSRQGAGSGARRLAQRDRSCSRITTPWIELRKKKARSRQGAGRGVARDLAL